MKVGEPFPIRIRYALEDVPEGTIASIHAEGDAGGFYKIAAPILNLMVHRNITNDRKKLKACVDGRG